MPALAPEIESAEAQFDRRFAVWLLSATVSELRRQTGVDRSTLYDWVAKRTRPRGIVRRALALFLVRWEEEREKARRVVPTPVREPRPPRWPGR